MWQGSAAAPEGELPAGASCLWLPTLAVAQCAIRHPQQNLCAHVSTTGLFSTCKPQHASRQHSGNVQSEGTAVESRRNVAGCNAMCWEGLNESAPASRWGTGSPPKALPHPAMQLPASSKGPGVSGYADDRKRHLQQYRTALYIDVEVSSCANEILASHLEENLSLGGERGKLGGGEKVLL